MQPAHGLDVVVEDVGPFSEHREQRLLLDAEEVGRQHLDRDARQLPLQCPDRRRVVAGPAVGHVVAVDGRDDHVLEVHLGRGLGEPERLERVGRRLGLPRVDVAVPARPGTRVAEDLEGRRSATPALGDVRAARLLADRVQAGAVDQLADVEVARVRARRAHFHPLGAARRVGYGKGALHG